MQQLYLLGTECLYDLALNDGNPVENWFNAQRNQRKLFTHNVVLSAFSAAVLHLHYQRAPPKTAAEVMHKANLDTLITQFKSADQLIGALPEVITRWVGSLATLSIDYKNADGTTSRCGFEEKLVLATAMCGDQGRPFILVDRFQEVHNQLGLQVEDPWQTTNP